MVISSRIIYLNLGIRERILGDSPGLVGERGDGCEQGRLRGDTALHEAASKGHIEVARALLQAGANARKSNN